LDVEGASPVVSVIIPVWNGEGTIARCLAALESQTLARDTFEVIVADNGSTDNTIAIVSQFDVQLLQVPEAGSYRARNAAIERARGKYLAFTDADCEPEPEWLATALEAAGKNDRVGIVAGDIVIHGDAPSLVMAYEQLFAFRQWKHVPEGRCATANWLSPAEIVRQFGGFDTRFKSGGDWNLSRAIKQAGYTIVYEPRMRVKHPPRGSVEEIARKRRRVAGGRWADSKSRGLTGAFASELTDCARKTKHVLGAKSLRLGVRLRLMGFIAFLSMESMREVVRLKRGGTARRA
jgi:glycosyltransferase involved in cell wall biosynthesis